MIFKKPTYDFLVVGLGNPGIQYEKTRHNVGFMSADLLMKKEGGEFTKHKIDSHYGECEIGKKRILVMKPQTFMNNSGTAVSAVSKFYKIPLDKIIIISDDISLDVGKIRIRRKGSHGGHNGLKDIFQLLGTDNIMRIKIGVGAKPHPDYDLADWVLGKFPEEDEENLNTALENSVRAIEEIIKRGIDSAMNKYSK
ncbi:MAG: aminoacyl-tRNA hydrolase [Acutalibacteraceae bacterium]|nr:aminoacyl-tRNA hydrolase [Acutalibacteraceae bacterium]